MKIITAVLTSLTLISVAQSQGINAPMPQPSPTITPSNPVVNTPSGPDVSVGGTRSYQQLSGPGGGGILTPNSNGTSTIVAPSGATQNVPTPR